MYLRNLGALDLYAEYYATDYGELAERINQLLGSGADGWVQEGGSWYYYKNGAALKAQWLKDGGHWYWLGEDGAMATGWLSWQGKLYWLNPEQREGVPEGACIITDSEGAVERSGKSQSLPSAGFTPSASVRPSKASSSASSAVGNAALKSSG